MIGYHAKKDVWFCDLNCYRCQGAVQNPCILVGMFSILKAQNICYEQTILLEEFMKPKPDCFWKDILIGTPDNFPIKEFPVYDSERVH